ncbi:hypothetical protein BpHYR1_000613 [Brachionus plicatilis]|uniref:Uncharacterized protein n=1 Tax=Brachionus plicatilis TaxID=10195 RepID=A0A3M7R670_BRAPC|nr:hypothetical protein BpHYR1_000613 [Brachionus plicatilis]
MKFENEFSHIFLKFQSISVNNSNTNVTNFLSNLSTKTHASISLKSCFMNSGPFLCLTVSLVVSVLFFLSDSEDLDKLFLLKFEPVRIKFFKKEKLLISEYINQKFDYFLKNCIIFKYIKI